MRLINILHPRSLAPSFIERLQTLELEFLSTRSLRFLQRLHLLNIPIWRVQSLTPRTKIKSLLELNSFVKVDDIPQGQNPKKTPSADYKPYLSTQAKKFDADPRPAEDLTEAIIPGFDKKGNSLSDPLPPHYPRLTQPDRQLSESAYVIGTKLLMPHRDNGSIPYHLSIKNIMAKSGCNADEARNLEDAFALLDATPKMVDVFCHWTEARSAEATLDYLWRYLIGIVEAEEEPREFTGIDEREPWEDEVVTTGNLLPGIFGKAGICEDAYPEKVTKKAEKRPMAVAVGNEIIWPQADEDGDFPWTPACEDDIESWNFEPPESNDNGSTVGYHVLQDFNRQTDLMNEIYGQCKDYDQREWYWDWKETADEEEVERMHHKLFSWEAKQPKGLKNLLTQIRKCPDLSELSELGKGLHGLELKQDHAGVIWTEYNSKKAALEGKIQLRPIARVFLQKIAQADGNIGSLGSYLYKVQKNEIKVKDTPSETEWRVIWKEYHEMKAMHA